VPTRKKFGAGINIPDRVSESSVTTFWVKNILNFCHFSVPVPDPESGAYSSPDPGWENPDPG
jgi:hypothetical protein